LTKIGISGYNLNYQKGAATGSMNILANKDLNILTNKDLQDVLSVIKIANNRSSLTEMRRNIVKSLQRAFQAESVTFFLADKEFKVIDNRSAITVGTDLRYIDDYAKRYSLLDPFQQDAHSRISVCKVDDILPYRHWVKSKIYTELYTKLNIHYKLSIHLRTPAKVLGTIGICRPRGRHDFSKQEMAKARILAPHLTTALENTFQFAADEETKVILDGFGCQSPPFGAIVLDLDLQVLYLSTGAAEFCNSFTNGKENTQAPKTENNGVPIPQEILGDCLILKQLYEHGNHSEPLRRLRIMGMADNKIFQVFSTFVKINLTGNPSFRFLVYIQDFSDISRNKEVLLKEKYHLTKREVDIARCVGKGLTNDEIGEKLYISRYTVETHLKNIFDKTGVKHRSGLSGLLQTP
jgi:DNA-binding CsgD family transcriptional regulator